jgi:hypothetical protein
VLWDVLWSDYADDMWYVYTALGAVLGSARIPPHSQVVLGDVTSIRKPRHLRALEAPDIDRIT